MVKPSNPRSRSSSRVAVTIAVRDFSLRRLGTRLRARLGEIGWHLVILVSQVLAILAAPDIERALHILTRPVVCHKTRRFVL